MSHYELVVPCHLHNDGNTMRSRTFHMILEALPWPESDKWYSLFKSEAGYAPVWAIELLSHEPGYTRHYNETSHREWNRYTVDPYFLEALHAGLKKDWNTFENVLGLWELSKAKD